MNHHATMVPERVDENRPLSTTSSETYSHSAYLTAKNKFAYYNSLIFFPHIFLNLVIS